MRSVTCILIPSIAFLACGTDVVDGPPPPPPPPPTVISVVVTPGTATLVSLGETVQLNASARDANGNAISGKTFTWSSSDESVAMVSSSGLVTAAANGTTTITPTTEGVSGTATITVDQVPAELAFAVQPTETQVNEGIHPAVEVLVRDASGHMVVNTTDAVTLAIGENPGGGTLLGTTSVELLDGVAKFEDLAIDELGYGYTLTASFSALTAASSAPFDIVFAFATVSTGDKHACGLSTSGTVYCWGSNEFGQLGDASNISSTRPVRVAGDLRFVEMTGGGRNHICGLTADGEAYCWGENPFGQIGDGTTTNSNVPVRAVDGAVFIALDAGVYHTCGVVATGEAYCWGSNASEGIEGFALGAPTTEMCDNPNPTYRGAQWPCSLTPLAVSSGIGFRTISAGLWATCGIALSGYSYCWGWNSTYQLGDGTETVTDATEPRLVAGGLLFDGLALGGFHGCGTVGQDAYCWGARAFNYGQLGTGSSVDGGSSAPTSVVGGLSFSTVVPSDGNNIYAFTCGLATTGSAYCWGASRYGALGTDVAGDPDCSVLCSTTPIAVTGGLTFVSISAGSEFACGVTHGRDVFCWGHNDLGQLGDGTTDDTATPVQVVVP